MTMSFNYAKGYSYKGYIIKKGDLGWFGEPVDDKPNAPRWGFTRNYPDKLMVEVEIDNMIDE